MIRIREKDILFIAINLVMFFSYCSYWFMREGALIAIGAMSTPYPSARDGLIYLLYSFSGIAISTAAMITLFIDFWWMYRFIRELQRGYWKENL